MHITLIVFIVSLFLVCCLSAFSILYARKHLTMFAAFLLSLSVILLGVVMYKAYPDAMAISTAEAKGLEKEKIDALTYEDLSDIYELNDIMPNDDSSVVNNTIIEDNDVIIFYRYNCPECKKYIGTIKKYYEDAGKHVYWCSTRSKAGKVLLNKFKNLSIAYVPTAVILEGDKYVAKTLDFKENPDGTLVLEEFE